MTPYFCDSSYLLNFDLTQRSSLPKINEEVYLQKRLTDFSVYLFS